MSSAIVFTPYAFAKYVFVRDLGKTEVGFMGITHPENPLLIIDVRIPKQECTSAFTDFDEDEIPDFYNGLTQEGYKIHQYSRVWLHTHPGNSATPSSVDEKTFREDFEDKPFACMIILARGGETYARGKWTPANKENCPPLPLTTELMEVLVAWKFPFPACDHLAWKAEYNANVSEKTFVYTGSSAGVHNGAYRTPQKYLPPAGKDGEDDKKKDSTAPRYSSNAQKQSNSEEDHWWNEEWADEYQEAYDKWAEAAKDRLADDIVLNSADDTDTIAIADELDVLECLDCQHVWTADGNDPENVDLYCKCPKCFSLSVDLRS